MVDATSNRTQRIGYDTARGLILVTGLLVLALVALVMYVRRVDPVEVSATLFFLPVFAAFLMWGVKGGVTLGALAAGAYVVMRYPAVQVVGTDHFLALIVTRAAGFLLFGFVGGWAAQQMRASLTKLDLYDQIDDATGLFNARSLVESVDLERSRAMRYEKVFSVAVVDFPREVFAASSRRQQAAVMKELGIRLEQSVRRADRVVHAVDGEQHVFAVVLPETGKAGADVFVGNFEERLVELLEARGVSADRRSFRSETVTFPDDEQGLSRVSARFRQIARAEHPERAVP